jgi:hypothetical protein
MYPPFPLPLANRVCEITGQTKRLICMYRRVLSRDVLDVLDVLGVYVCGATGAKEKRKEEERCMGVR